MGSVNNTTTTRKPHTNNIQPQGRKKDLIMARIATCMCPTCNRVGTHPVAIANRGNRNGFLCDYHFRNDEGYSFENPTRRGNRKVNGFTFSYELESNGHNQKSRTELANMGFIPTNDSTVRCEYKSPIYEGLNAISKQVVSIEKMVENGWLSFADRNGNTCGTHFHVGHVDGINPRTMEYIRRFYHSLFVPLSNAMVADPNKTAAFWGRNFTYYASPISYHSSAMAHENFINLQHDYTIEFRLAKFQTAAQYMQVAKFCRDVVNAILNNFVAHFNDTDFDTSRYENQTAYRKHKAMVTGNKIVKLWEKYTEGM